MERIKRLLIITALIPAVLLAACSGADRRESRPFSSGGRVTLWQSLFGPNVKDEPASEPEHEPETAEKTLPAEEQPAEEVNPERGKIVEKDGKTLYVNDFTGITIDLTGWTVLPLDEIAENFEVPLEQLQNWTGEDFRTNIVTPDLVAVHRSGMSMMSFYENTDLFDVQMDTVEKYLLFQEEQMNKNENDKKFSFSEPFLIELSGQQFMGISCTYTSGNASFGQYILVKQYGQYMYVISAMGLWFKDPGNVFELFQ